MPEPNRVQMRGGEVLFIGRRACLARHDAARRVMMPREPCSCHVAILSFHASTSPNLPRFSRAYPFLTRFSRAVLEVFRNSKWVMQYIAGKLSTSSFQRYKVCVNRSLDERVMAPGSRGAGAVFVCFSGKDSGQMGDAFGKPRVPRRSRSHYLSNAPGSRINLLRVGRTLRAKAAVREEKCVLLPARFFSNLVPVRARF